MGIWVGRYAIVDGEVREYGPWLAERRRARDDEPVRLVVLAEPTDARSAPFCHEVAEAVAELFSRESLSVTGGMLRALRQAHDNLAEWNRRSLREHRVAVGVTCVATRGAEATIAQVGPGVVYLAGRGGLQRSVAEDEAAHPLGGAEPIAPQFLRADLRAQEVLLLTAEGEQVAGAAAVGEALAAGPERALAELFVRTRDARDMVAALIAEIEGVEDEPEDDTPFAGIDIDFESFEAAEAASAREGRNGRGEPAPALGPNAEPGQAPDRESASAEPEHAPGRHRAPVRHERERRASEREARASGTRRAEGVSVIGAPEEPAPLDSGSRASRRAGAVTRERRGALPALRRARVAGGGLARATPRRWRPWAAVALTLLIVFALLWWAVPTLLAEDRDAQLAEALAEASLQVAAAEAATEPAVQREHAQAALSALARARSAAPEDPGIAPLESRAQAIIDALDAVTELAPPRTVLAFSGVITAPFAPASLSYGGGTLWLVDAEGGRVFALAPTGGDPATVYTAGETYGETTAATPLAVAWDDVGGRLLVIDTERVLYEVTRTVEGLTTPAPLVLREADELDSVTDIAAYDGNLYVLDGEGGDVWRYLPAGDGFDSERSSLLGGADLEEARRLLVDGDVFVLQDGGLRRFRQGVEQAALFEAIDRPLEGAQALAAADDGERLYVADRANRRIAVSERAGRFARQYVHPELFDLRGLAMPPGGELLYALTGEAILEFRLPAPAAAPEPTSEPTSGPTSGTPAGDSTAATEAAAESAADAGSAADGEAGATGEGDE